MGWCSEDGSHEGYLVTLVHDDAGAFLGPGGYARDSVNTSGRMRELGAPGDADRAPFYPRHLKAACSCGWRSPLLQAPSGVEWAPFTTVAPDWFQDAARALWKRHIEHTGPVADGGLRLRQQA